MVASSPVSMLHSHIFDIYVKAGERGCYYSYLYYKSLYHEIFTVLLQDTVLRIIVREEDNTNDRNAVAGTMLNPAKVVGHSP